MPRQHNGSRYHEITERVLEALRDHCIPWSRPWRCEPPRNAFTLRPYRGINRVLLDMTTAERGYTCGSWVTFNAARKAGGAIRQGEKGTMVLYYERRERQRGETPTWDREADDRHFFLCRHYWLFNLDQTVGLDSLRPEPREIDSSPVGDRAESVIANSGAHVITGGERACYVPMTDTIYLPERNRFVSEVGWIATGFHELAHWTGNDKRLARDLGGRFGDQRYAAEELVAELTAAFLCGEIGAEIPIDNCAAYLSGWIQLLEEHSSAFITAAREAQRAADFVLGTVGAEIETEDPNTSVIEEVHHAV